MNEDLWARLLIYAMQKDDSFKKNFICTFVNNIGKDALCKSYYDLHVLLWDAHFTKDTAIYAVSCMENSDNTVGEKVTKEVTDKWYKAYGFNGDTFNDWDWYYVVNMVFSDYGTLYDNEESLSLIAKAWICDKDVPEGKAFRYWGKVVNG